MHFPMGSVLGVFISLSNLGTRPLRISKVSALITHDEGSALDLTCNLVFLRPEDRVGVTFLPVYLKPGETWGGHFTNFSNRSRENWKQARQNEDLLQKDVNTFFLTDQEKAARKAVEERQRALFLKTLYWQPGHYNIVFTAEIDGIKQPITANYIFGLLDSDIDEIKQATELIGQQGPIIKNWPSVTMTETKGRKGK